MSPLLFKTKIDKAIKEATMKKQIDVMIMVMILVDTEGNIKRKPEKTFECYDLFSK